MPRVPTYGNRKVETAPLPGARVDVRAPDNAFAPVDIGPAANIVSQVDEKQTLDNDEMVVNNAERQLIDARLKILQDPETGAINRRGINALTAMPDAQEAWAKRTSEIAEGLTNDRQKEAFQRRERGHYASLSEQIAAHTSAEVRRADTETIKAFLDDGLADVHATPEKAPAAILDAQTRLVEFGQRQGWSPETLKSKAAAHVSDIHEAALNAIVRRGTPESAQQAKTYLDANRSGLIGGQLDHAERLVDEAVSQGAGIAEADAILGINQQTATLPSKGQQDGTVPPTVKVAGKKPEVTALAPKEEESFKKWAEDNKIADVDDPRSFYDYRGYWKDVASKGVDQRKEYDDGLHFPDTYKQHGHPTFSVESKYSKGAGDGGTWDGETYVPAKQPQGPATTRVEALARAEAIADPRARKAAVEAVVSHFTRMETMQRLDRNEAAESVLQQLEATGGRLNRASPAWLKIAGTSQGEHVLARQKQLLNPPSDPGDPELFMSHLQMATGSPAMREEFLRMNIAGKDGKGLSTSQRTRLIQMQGTYRGQETRQDASGAVTAETLRFQRENALLKAVEDHGGMGAKLSPEDKKALDAEVTRIKNHYDALERAHKAVAPATSPAPVKPAQKAAPVISLSEVPDPAAHPVYEPTRQMLEEAAQSPAYAARLRELGVRLPAVLPAPVVVKK